MSRRNLEGWEVEHLARLIVDTNPNRLQPHHREIWEGVRGEFNRGLSLGNEVWLSEKQISVIRRSHATSRRIEAKLQQPNQLHDINSKLDVVANPMK